ncbi:hypothetical protein [Leptospira sp. GIMC2001]|uniref:hypothetical protein n=1 Tax=Leptospira sp. GIMC2001 TaxID=1513297 RepID=UPI0023495175|nr:hypothetical protein [Leptospira sp. GIMC2001]WCL48098.1 hypothetical protein O4O04_12315 [Leptospira sp. GIMC2001]
MILNPNSNLLTVAESPTQQHLYCLLVIYLIHKHLQMVLGSPKKNTENAYDAKGQAIVEKRSIDDLTLFFQRSYDELGRMKTFTYPEGTKIENVYLPSGQRTTILIYVHDGNYPNQPISLNFARSVQKDFLLAMQCI